MTQRPTTGSRLDGLLGYHLRRAQLRAFAAFAREVDGLSPMLFGVLATIEAQPGIGQGEIADALGADRSTMVRLVDQLERRGLVRRESRPDDRRTVIPTLTPDGRAALAAATPQVLASEELFAADLSPEERRVLAALLQRISAG
ncbi:MAG TPA: MarR family transcriptional regulator [Candidatus Sulfotelmatobacter sp.]|nr:MarR family transcriptional regulator [Candidatus Sulfotelmatobacter sp.]